MLFTYLRLRDFLRQTYVFLACTFALIINFSKRRTLPLRKTLMHVWFPITNCSNQTLSAALTKAAIPIIPKKVNSTVNRAQNVSEVKQILQKLVHLEAALGRVQCNLPPVLVTHCPPFSMPI